jgi:hypothetical protein
MGSGSGMNITVGICQAKMKEVTGARQMYMKSFIIHLLHEILLD